MENQLWVTLQPDMQFSEDHYIIGDPEKYLIPQGSDSLHLYSPCCDRFNYHFVRQGTN